MSDLAGKTAVVSGAAQGIGRAVAERLARSGANLVLVDIDESQLARTASELSEAAAGLGVEAYAGDVSDPATLTLAVGLAESAFGAVDIAVGVAGIVEIGDLLNVSPDGWRRVLGVNLDGMWHLTQAAARSMARASMPGSIILISSTNAFYPEAGTVAYSTSKAAVIGLAKAASLDLAPRGIRVNAVAPGIIETRLSSVLTEDPQAGADYLQRIPLGRWGSPAQVADACAFLASEDSAYITGAVLTVDGGATVGIALGVPDTAIDEHGAGRRPEPA